MVFESSMDDIRFYFEGVTKDFTGFGGSPAAPGHEDLGPKSRGRKWVSTPGSY